MANIAAVLKFGYYPTQPGIVPLIARYLYYYYSPYSVTKDRYVLYDPCCGAGDALAELRDCLVAQQDYPAGTEKPFYLMGSELDANRAEAAKKKFGKDGVVVQGDVYDYTLTKHGAPIPCVDLLFGNSPYDVYFPTAGEGDRYEISILDHVLDTLAYDGVLVYIVRERLLRDYAVELTRVLESHSMLSIKVYRYPEPTYSEFQQVVIFAKRKHSPNMAYQYSGDLAVLGDLEACAPPKPQDVSSRYGYGYNSTHFDRKYHLSSSATKGNLPKFYKLPDLSTVQPFHTELFPAVGDPNLNAPFRPLANIRQEHAILLAASGFLDGIQIGNQVVRGFNERVIEKITQDHDEGGGYDEIEIERFVHTISILDLDTGVIQSINDYGNLSRYEEIMLELAPPLLEQVRRMYRPEYEAHMADRYRDSFAWVRSSKRLPGIEGHGGELLEPQVQVAAAIVRGWETGRKVVTVGGEMSVGKTGISLAAAWHKMRTSRAKDGRDLRRLVILCPASKPAVMKWMDEANDLLGRNGRTDGDPRIDGGAGVFLLRTVADVDRMFAFDGPAIGVLAETSAKLTSGWTNVLGACREIRKRADVTVQAHDFAAGKNLFPIGRSNCCYLRDKDGNFRLLHETENIPVTAVIDKLAETAEFFVERDGQREPVYTFRALYDYRVGRVCPHCGKVMPGDAISPRMWSGKEKAFCPLCKSALWRVESKKGEQARTLPEALGDFERLSAELRATRVPIWPGKHSNIRPFRLAKNRVRLVRNLKMESLRARKRLDAIRRRRNFENPGGKIALAKYIRNQYRGRFGLIIDEAHEFRAQDSARGYITMDLIESCRWAVQMTGTLSNGMASSIFYLLYRSNPDFRRMYGFTEVQKFVDMYGLQERTTRYYGDSSSVLFSGYRQYDQAPSEIPGTHPGMASLMLRDSVFVTLSDLNYAMPPYSESTLFVPMDGDLAGEYNAFVDAAGSVIRAAMEIKDMRAVSLASHMKYRTLDRPTVMETVSTGDNITGTKTATFDLTLTDPDHIYPKEEAFLRLLLEQKTHPDGPRPVLCFIGQINAGDPTPRLLRLMQRYGLKGTVLRQDTTNDRVAFVTDAVLNQGCDVVFTSPKLVTVSVDLLYTPTIVWYGVAFETNLYEQANRRPWRLTQTRPVEVFYLAYQSTVQAAAFDYVARKIQAAVILQGRMIEGLAALRGGESFVRNLQSLISHGESYDSDLTMDSFPPLPVLAKPPKLEVVAPDLVQPYLPRWLAKRAAQQPGKYVFGICPHCQLPIDPHEVMWTARYNGGIYWFHRQCVERTNHGTYVPVQVAESVG